MSQPDSSKRNQRTIFREQSQRDGVWRRVTQRIATARFLGRVKAGGWQGAALLILAIHAPARADKPCSGGDSDVARPIAATLQPNASAIDPNGRFEVKIQSNDDLTTNVYLRPSVGSKELFRAITKLRAALEAAVVLRLPASEGVGFSLQVEDGGSGLRNVCAYGFRFQNGVVYYRTLAARAKSRDGGVFAGDATEWQTALTKAQRPSSQQAAAVSSTRASAQQRRAPTQLGPSTNVQLREADMTGEIFVLSPDLNYVASTLYDPKRANDPSVRGRIRAWDATTGARIAEWPAHAATIQSLALSPRGDLLASSASDRSVAVWRLPEGRKIAAWVDPTESIQSLSFDGSGTILVGGGSKVVRIWNAATGSLRSSIEKGDGPTAVNPDGSLIASPAAVFEVGSGRVVRSISVTGGSSCMAFSPDGRYFVLCQWDRVELWEVSSWRMAWKFQRDSRHVPFNALAFHPNGQHLAATLGDSIWLLDLGTGKPVAFVPGSGAPTTFPALGFASNGNALVAVTGSQIKRWSTN